MAITEADNISMEPMRPNKEEKLEKQDQDYETPFSFPYDAKGKIAPDHPTTDDALDSQQLYDEGLSAAAGIDESAPKRSKVTAYKPKIKNPKK